MAVAGDFRVDLTALAASAVRAGGQGEDLAMAHVASDDRIQGALSGWAGVSAAAMAAKADAWLVTSQTLLTRVGDHVSALDNDGVAFAARERENAETVRAVGAGAIGMAGATRG
ncbi:hypothetical protein [Mycobacterium sp.]|uniref:hypothetical protein n=1 Tax=Mycobacterium sp. TaxID=1785 RepID=UPI00126DEF37|nr:hypothetical protein [Mycobacterium sp.]KAA8961774.1 MAG: hypothetical protein F6Q13_12415 [Mycobacterium sp.]